jgi:cytochrome c551/c552
MKTKSLLLLLSLSLMAIGTWASPPVEEGKTIFTKRCAACHSVNKNLTGPALSGVDMRHSIDWIINFVHSSQKMVQSGDTAAVAVFQKFNKVPMPDHTDLTNDDIKSVVEYIKAESKPVTTDVAPFATPGKRKDFYLPIKATNYAFWGGYLAVVAVLIAALYFAVQLKSFENLKRGNDVSA